MATKDPFQELVRVIARLRGPKGCPWDRTQTHKSLKPFLLEETYETLEAIDHGSPAKLREELGDLLMQVVLHAQLAKEKNRFAIQDVVTDTTKKLIRRHPHVFGGIKVKGAEEAWKNWEKIKADEAMTLKGKKIPSSYMEGVPKALPALARADKVQRKAARAGFDWDRVAEAWKKVHEEISEIEDILKSKGRKTVRKSRLALQEEIGDLLFAIVNVTRKLDFHAEELLHQGVNKFMRRFQKLEQKARQAKRQLSHLSLKEMDKIWEDIKG